MLNNVATISLFIDAKKRFEVIDEERLWRNFLRQRRNLVAISSALIFIKLAKLHFDSELMFFGNHILIGQPKAIVWALWTVFAYWFYRYYVFFHDIGAKGYMSTFNIALRTRARIRAIKNFEKRTGKKVDNTIYKTNKETAPLWRVWKPGDYRILVQGPYYNKEGTLINESHEIEERLHDWEVKYLSLFVHARIIFNSHHFTEYTLPIITAVSAIILWFVCPS